MQSKRTHDCIHVNAYLMNERDIFVSWKHNFFVVFHRPYWNGKTRTLCPTARLTLTQLTGRLGSFS